MLTMVPTLYVFHCNPAARAVLMAAKHLGLNCNVKEIDMIKDEHKSPEFRKINPECSIPTLDDDGFILSDSHAILPYLVTKYGSSEDSLYPSSDLRRKASIDQRLHFENGVLFPRVVAIGLFPNFASTHIMAPPTLYMNPATPGVRSVLMTAKCLNLELNKKYIDTMKGETKTPEFIKMNPQHTVPTLDDNGYILWESHAILPYIVDKYGKDDALYPKDLQKRSTINQRLHFASGLLYPRFGAVLSKKVFQKTEPDQKEWDSLHEAYDFLEVFVENGYIFGSSLTIADFAVVVILASMELIQKIDTAKWPKLTAWLRKMEALPCYSESKEGIEKIKEFFINAANK